MNSGRVYAERRLFRYAERRFFRLFAKAARIIIHDLFWIDNRSGTLRSRPRKYCLITTLSSEGKQRTVVGLDPEVKRVDGELVVVFTKRCIPLPAPVEIVYRYTLAQLVKHGCSHKARWNEKYCGGKRAQMMASKRIMVSLAEIVEAWTWDLRTRHAGIRLA